MRIDIDGGGYDSAADALLNGNHLAALYYNSFIGKLGGYGAMAGDDKTSEDFVANYDTAAREAVGAANDVVDGLASLYSLTAASIANHRAANQASVFGVPPVYDGSTSLPDNKPVDVTDFTPPTALGGDNEDLPELWNHVVDHLQGYTWPSADVAKLREACSEWKGMGDDLDRLEGYCDTALEMLAGQTSPEVPVADQALREFKTHIGDVATEFRAIGQGCSDYADAVETTRETVKGLLRDLAIEVGITAGLSAIGSLVTFGGAAVVGAGVIAARALRYVPKILAALRALRVVRAVGAILKSRGAVRIVRAALKKFKRPVPKRSGSATNRAAHEAYKRQLRREMSKPEVKDPKLKKEMDELWRDNAQVGNGSTAAAVREELATGRPVGGRWHSQKAEDAVRFLQKWLKNNPEAPASDRHAAENVIQDLLDALAGR